MAVTKQIVPIMQGSRFGKGSIDGRGSVHFLDVAGVHLLVQNPVRKILIFCGSCLATKFINGLFMSAGIGMVLYASAQAFFNAAEAVTTGTFIWNNRPCLLEGTKITFIVFLS